MQYENVCLEAFGYTLPDEVVTSEQIEQRLEPLYRRLRLPEGRLELMTGIRERRFWDRGVLPGEKSVESGRRAVAAAGIDPEHIGLLVHGSVCRDYLEPATACSVHHRLELPESCVIYDVSNACLGLMNGVLQVGSSSCSPFMLVFDFVITSALPNVCDGAGTVRVTILTTP